MSDDYLNRPFAINDNTPPAPTQKLTPISPYLNYDPRFLQQNQPEYIFPEGASKQRGRFELAFSQIGSSVMIGAAIGGTAGLYNGVRSTALLQQSGKLRRTQLLNHIMKQGSGTANTLGTLAVMYSAFGVILQYARGEDDEINTVLAATGTGLLYKSSAGLKKCAVGGGIGLALAAAYCIYNAANRSKRYGSSQYL